MITSPGDPGWMLPLQLIILSAFAISFGSYMAKVYKYEPVSLSTYFGWVERTIYALAGVDATKRMDWKTYAMAALTFSAAGFICLYLLLALQVGLTGASTQAGLSPEAAFALAGSYITGTSLPRGTATGIGVLPATIGLTVQRFLSAAVGMSVFIALARALSPRTYAIGIGNFWTDLVRTSLYVLLPLSLIFVVLTATSGIGDAIDVYAAVGHTNNASSSLMAQAGASAEAMKLLILGDGSYLTATSASTSAPGFTMRLIAFLSALLIPVALCQTFGKIVEHRQQALFMILPMMVLSAPAFMRGNPNFPQPIFTGDASLLFSILAMTILSAGALSALRGQKPSYLNNRIGPFELKMAGLMLVLPFALMPLIGGLVLQTNLAPIAVWMKPSGLYPILGFVLLFARFWVIIPALAIAGSLANKAPPLSASQGASPCLP
jgi:K+-transporting ATPase A subunit